MVVDIFMKYYLVNLRQNKETVVKAKGYHKDGEQYVFEASDPAEVQFFLVSEVVGISILRDDEDPSGPRIVSVPL